MRSDRSRSLAGLHLAMAFGGGTALFAKLIDLSALAITGWRSVFAVAALAALMLAAGQRIRLHRGRDYALAMALGTLFALHWASYFHAIQLSTVAVGIVALFTFPIMTVLLEPLLDGARPGIADLAAGLAGLAGVALMVPQASLADATTRGVAWGLVSALLYATRNTLQRRHFAHYPGTVAMFWQMLAVVAVALPLAVLAGDAAPETEQWHELALLGVVFTALPHSLLAHSLRHFRAATVGLINCLQVLYATVLSALLLGEIPTPSTALGGTLVIGAAVWESARASGIGPARTEP